MGTERSLRILKRMGVFVFWLVTGYVQAATFTVNSPSDVSDANPGNGICSTPGGVCTLRAAIEEANALAGADQIALPALPAPSAYLLTSAVQLTITDDLTITGGGASATIIDGNKAVRPESGVLAIADATVNISGVSIRNGGRASGSGGGISNSDGALTLTNSTVSGNSARLGGGIRALGGNLTLINSTVSSNSASDRGGGMFHNSGVTVALINSTVSGNSASFDGGGIYAASGGNRH